MTHPRDGVAGLDGDPAIVSVSDVHGYLDRVRSALRAVGDHPAFDPLVETGDDGRLHWAGNDYVLVFNGDLVDRGPDSRGVLELARRLRAEAPNWRVRYNLGNHESALPWPSPPEHDRYFVDGVTDEERREFYRLILDGAVTLAYGGYEYTFVHAGAADGVDPVAANERLREITARLVDVVGTDKDREVHLRAFDEGHFDLLGHGGEDDARGPDAGPLWLDFEHLPADAPLQVVGHTPHDEPTRKGNVVCGDTILENLDSPGGEAVLMETPDSLRALVREPDGDVALREL